MNQYLIADVEIEATQAVGQNKHSCNRYTLSLQGVYLSFQQLIKSKAPIFDISRFPILLVSLD
jgi:hypothetical protein